MKKTTFLPGFSLLELLIGSTIMGVMFLGTLAIYTQSHKISVDQQQFVELQQDVRAAIFHIAKDVRMAGAGLPEALAGAAIEGFDNETTGGTETPDRLRIMGDIEDPMVLRVAQYQGSTSTAGVDNFSFEREPFPDGYYLGKPVLILPKTGSTCRGAALRQVAQVLHPADGRNEGFVFAPGGASGITLPGGLADVCPDGEYQTGGSLLFADVREFWLDVTGYAPGLTAGQDGYLGGGLGDILYMTRNGAHHPLAQNIETLQFQYNGDFDADEAGRQDGFTDWNEAWTPAQIGRIRQVRIMVLGRTRDVFTSIAKAPILDHHHYRRPGVANTAAASADDWRRRFLMESTSAIRNLSLNIYNTGLR